MSNLIDYVRHTMPTFQVNRHHERIAERLDALRRGDIRRLIVCQPPRYGMTELCVKRFAGHCADCDPTESMSYSTYAMEMTDSIVRELRRQNVWLNPLPVRGRVAERRIPVELAIIDSPIRNVTDARSQLHRDRLWNWYRESLLPLLSTDARILICTPRWHADDLIGRLLATEADQWEVLTFPAVSADGKSLWPEWQSSERLNEIRMQSPELFASLYQQQPE